MSRPDENAVAWAAERDQWRAIGRIVRDEAVVELLGLDICAFCGGFVEGTEDLLGPVQHSDWCPVTRIRVLLGEETL